MRERGEKRSKQGFFFSLFGESEVKEERKEGRE